MAEALRWNIAPRTYPSGVGRRIIREAQNHFASNLSAVQTMERGRAGAFLCPRRVSFPTNSTHYLR